jgi:hypothetical protein
MLKHQSKLTQLSKIPSYLLQNNSILPNQPFLPSSYQLFMITAPPYPLLSILIIILLLPLFRIWGNCTKKNRNPKKKVIRRKERSTIKEVKDTRQKIK